jgi:hypothetical protein
MPPSFFIVNCQVLLAKFIFYTFHQVTMRSILIFNMVANCMIYLGITVLALPSLMAW